MSIDIPAWSTVGAVPDHLPEDLVRTVLAAWPGPDELDLIWSRGAALLADPAPSQTWVALRVGDLGHHRDWGCLKSRQTGRWSQVVPIDTSGFVVELGDRDGTVLQVARDIATRDSRPSTTLAGISRVDGRRAVVRTGRGWVHHRIAAAAVMWRWCTDGRVRTRHTTREVL